MCEGPSLAWQLAVLLEAHFVGCATNHQQEMLVSAKLLALGEMGLAQIRSSPMCAQSPCPGTATGPLCGVHPVSYPPSAVLKSLRPQSKEEVRLWTSSHCGSQRVV